MSEYLVYKTNKIHVWQGERCDGALKFMYKPVITSVIKLLQQSNQNVEINYKINYHNFNDINANEVLIWIGCEQVPNFAALNEKVSTQYITILNRI